MKTIREKNVLGWLALVALVSLWTFGWFHPVPQSGFDPEYSGVSHQGRW